MRSTYITATVIALLLIAWLLSGELGGEDAPAPGTIAEQLRSQARVDEDAAPTRVRVAVLQASERSRSIKVRGKTENKRTVMVKAELPGRVVRRPVDRGTPVNAGDTLCELSIEDRQVALVEARSALNQARIEYQGALSLKAKGFNSEAAIAAAKARLAAAEASLSRRELDLGKIHVRAPFAGVVEDVHLEIGDYVTPGANCATVVDLDPMLLVGRVSERDVQQLAVGQPATGYLSDGRTVTGPVSFIGQQSDPATRTYAVEIELPNPDHALRSGITTEIHVPVQQVMAQKISPALFALSDDGQIGVRTVNADNIVQFHLVDVLADAPDGVWVTGLPNRASVIVVGQELVTPGERIDPIYLGSETMPARSEPQPGKPPPADSATATATPGGDGEASAAPVLSAGAAGH